MLFWRFLYNTSLLRGFMVSGSNGENFGVTQLPDLVDLDALQGMADSHFKTTGIPIGLIDAFDGSILVGAGWQDICLNFHRATPETLKCCQESDTFINAHLSEDEPCAYKCLNGLWDIGIPIIVSEQHLATLFLGQFFYEGEVPDRQFFSNQAEKYSFNKKDYLDALDRVPIFSRDKVQTILEYDSSLVGFIADLAEKALLQKQEKQRRERLEAKLLESQKIESIGRLAGGIAHDFNNMIGVIMGQAELSMATLQPKSKLYSELENIYKAAEHSAELTHQLLAFARKQVIKPKVINLSDTIAKMLKMLHRLVGEGIDLKWCPADDLWPVKIDPAQIDQVLANLCVNARDATAGSGQLTIELSNCEVAAHFIEYEEIPAGQYVKLSVLDDGCGMDSATVSQVFEPFYTTKAIGEGTGLGLATVDGIIKQNNGFITVYSERGKGTVFNVYLPSCADFPEFVEEDGAIGYSTGYETVLLVEDEERLLKTTREILRSLHYTVLTANSPQQAVEFAKQYQKPIHLLLTDVVMPKMSGPELAEKVSDISPDCRVLYMSGYTANMIVNQGVLKENIHFIQKPFTQKELGESIQKILQSS